MAEKYSHLCSDLIRVLAPKRAIIGNLEAIGPAGCRFTSEEPPRPGQPIRMQCTECPAGKKACTECVFHGIVMGHVEQTPLGTTVEVKFDGREWSPEHWKPRSLTNPDELPRKRRPLEEDHQSPEVI